MYDELHRVLFILIAFFRAVRSVMRSGFNPQRLSLFALQILTKPWLHKYTQWIHLLCVLKGHASPL